MSVQDTRRRRFLGALVAAAGLAAFANGMGGTFVFDDHTWIVENPAIRALRTSVLYSSRPLVGLSLYLNYAAGGPRPAGYHAFNVAIHLAAGLVLFLVVGRTLRLCGAGESPRRDWLAAVVATTWVVHPLHTESVTYVIQRSESMMGLFYLLTLFCFIEGIRSPRRWHAAAACCCALGMACKPVMVTAPVAVLLYDRFFVSGSFARAARERAGLYALLACTWLVPIALLLAPNESSTSAGFGAGLLSPLRYLASQPAVLVRYLRLSAWPTGLCLDYGWQAPGTMTDILLPASALLLALAATLIAARRGHVAAYAAIWFFLVLAPSSSLVPLADLAAEHRMYLPLAGVIVLAALGGERLLRAVTERGRERGEVAAVAGLVIAIAVVLALGLQTASRNRDYRSRERMWRSVLAVRPDNPRAGFGLGTALLARGNLAGAERHFLAVLEAIPDADAAGRRDLLSLYAMLQNNLGAVRFARGEYGRAEQHFREALSVSPRYRDARRNLERAQRKRPR